MKLIKFNGNALLSNDKLIRKNDLADNTWKEIMQQILDGTAPSRWVGQSKLVNIGGLNYYALCVDNTYGRYQKADGTYTTLTFVIYYLPLKEVRYNYSVPHNANQLISLLFDPGELSTFEAVAVRKTVENLRTQYICHLRLESEPSGVMISSNI
jgi:hypothetical protein